MHTEVHVHGTIPLKSGASSADIEQALRPWLDYVDVENLGEARSAHEDEPGIVLDRRRRALDICWTGWVGRNFQNSLEAAFVALSPYSDEATAIEVSYYQEEGQDEHGWVFVGPSVESIQEMQRRRMADDVAALLSRQFSEVEVGEVVALVDQLYVRRWADSGAPALEPGRIQGRTARSTGKKHLH
ncbi:MAG: hypothetical protein EXR27_03920 [Betaproteobacteria bacterium]|nr:hypothetical protein [Betaproteobacteria bacterium]